MLQELSCTQSYPVSDQSWLQLPRAENALQLPLQLRLQAATTSGFHSTAATTYTKFYVSHGQYSLYGWWSSHP